jgi:DNA polymerase III subunit delta
MPDDLQPDTVLKAARKEQVAPFYLFYGPDEFRMEKVLATLRTLLVPEAVRDFNLEVLYGDDKIGDEHIEPEGVVNKASSVPFLAQRRLIILRRTESLTADQLERFLPYLEKPSPSTCLVFISSRTNFNTKFYKKFRSEGVAVLFDELKGKKIVPWIKRTASEDLGMTLDGEACAYLHAVVGNRPRELYSELEKLHLRYGKTVSLDQVKEAVTHSRVYTIFELMDAVSTKDCGSSLRILKRYLEEEDPRDAPLGLISMLNRQIRLLWQTKAVLLKRGGTQEVQKKTGLSGFPVKKLVEQAPRWTEKELEDALERLRWSDDRLKSGSSSKVILETLILSLCS